MVGTFELVGLLEMVGVAEEEVGSIEIVNPAGVVCKPETEGVLSRG